MEQTLISKKALADVYKKWIDDCATENMKTECGVIEDCLCELYEQEVIDPVHAAGGCYCGECVLWDKTNRGFGDECVCKRWSELDIMSSYTKPIDFCSYGEPKENSLPAQADREAGKDGV